jgi:hypothetical protein
MIGAPPDTLADRSILVPMRRKRSNEAVERFRIDRDPGFSDLSRQCARWVADHEDRQSLVLDLQEGVIDVLVEEGVTLILTPLGVIEFRPHSSLGERTPSQVAGAGDWVPRVPGKARN